MPCPYLIGSSYCEISACIVVNEYDLRVISSFHPVALLTSDPLVFLRINYPYLTNDLMNATSAEVHSLGMRFSIYNTMRELSNRCAEVCLCV